ncbi:MAG: RDD family protein [Elusimicrobia bacterium]|nr:RDD family protein [Elusimicrobiota bacterium]
MKTKHLAIMLTDIKGFTSRTAASSRSETLEMLQRHKDLVLPVIEKHSGRVVKTIGDAFLVVFESPTDAVLCGVEVQDALKAHNAEKAGADRIEIRIAINSGEVTVADDGDIFGDAVNITARLESIAEVGQVFFTEAVYLAMNKKEVPSSEIGYRQFKGVPEKIKVFRVLREVPVGAQPLGDELAEAGAAPAAAPKAAGFFHRLLSLLLDVTIFMILAGTLGLRSCGPDAMVSSEEAREAAPPAIGVNNVRIDKTGINITGDKGETIAIGKAGTVIKGPDGKIWAKKTSTRFAVNKDKKKIPLSMLIWVIYGAIFMWRLGFTPGMKIMKLKIVDPATGGPVPADKIFLRAFFSLVSLFGLLGYVWALWEKDHRTWHDIIAGTTVVRT